MSRMIIFTFFYILLASSSLSAPREKQWLDSFIKAHKQYITYAYEYDSRASEKTYKASETGRADWNALPVRLKLKGRVAASSQQIYLSADYFDVNEPAALQQKKVEYWDGKFFWLLYYPPNEKLWLPVFSITVEDSHSILSSIGSYGAYLDGRIPSLPFEDWTILLQKATQLEVSSGTQAIHGFPCRLVQGRYSNFTFKFWVDEQHGYNYRQAEIGIRVPPSSSRWKRIFQLHHKEQVKEIEMKIQDVQLQDHAPFLAVSGVERVVSFTDAGGRSLYQNAVKRANIMVDRTPPNAFALELPEGALVNEKSTGLTSIWHKGKLMPFVDPVEELRVYESLKKIAFALSAGKLNLSQDFHPNPNSLSSGVDSTSTQAMTMHPSMDLIGTPYDLYGVFLALKLSGHPVMIQDLLKPEFIDNAHNDTCQKVSKAIKQFGMYARASFALNTAALRKLNIPVLIHTKRERSSKKYDNYELYIGMQDGKALLFSAGVGLRQEPLEKLASRWDGSGVLISKKPISSWPLLSSLALSYILVAALGCATIVGSWRLTRHHYHRTINIYPLRTSAVQFGTLIALSCIVAAGWHGLRAEGFLSHRDVIEPVRIARIGYFLPVADLKSVIRIVKGEDKAVLIDARDKPTYYRGHIPGALPIPVDEIDSMRRDMARYDKGARLVVYCAGEECGIAKRMAAQLYDEGYRNIQIYAGGWEEWQHHLQSGDQAGEKKGNDNGIS